MKETINNKGVTLIVLAITIIILLILTGVSLYALTKDDATIKQAKDIQNIMEKQELIEALEMVSIEIAKGTTSRTYEEVFTEKGLSGTVESDGSIMVEGEKIGNITLPSTKVEEKTGSWNGKINTPIISDGMIPIKHNGDKWVVCRQDDPDWYDYKAQVSTTEEGGTSRWANIMLSDGKYKSTTVADKQVIEENELGSMFVWIPRYAYSIKTGYHTKNTGEIDIKFISTNIKNQEDKINKEITIENETGEKNWNIPPAFTYDGEQLTGFYVAKFEATGTQAAVTVKPSQDALGNLNVSQIHTTCINMNKSNNIYGINVNDEIIDPHMQKNSEWGAVAYLAHSKYGRNGSEVTKNNSQSKTGNAGNQIEQSYVPEILNAYNTEKGKLASTTGNIYGVYDMSGGKIEFVAGYINSGHEDLERYGKDLIEADSKYKNVYVKSEQNTIQANYELKENRDIFGEAIYETSGFYQSSNSWNGDYSHFFDGENSFLVRGGGHWYGNYSGIFMFRYI